MMKLLLSGASYSEPALKVQPPVCGALGRARDA